MTNPGCRTGRLTAQSRFATAGLVLALLVSSPPKSSAAPPPPSSRSQPNISITAYLSDFDSQGLPADTASDGLGAYRDGVDGVSSYLIPDGGNWLFNTYNSPTRGVTHALDQDDAVQPGDPHYTAPASPPFWGAQSLPSNNQLDCTNASHALLTMAAGSSFTCPLLNDFVAPNGVTYGLQTAPEMNGFLETTDVQVTCNTSDAGGCNDWFIDPIAPGPAVGRLVHRESTSRNKTVQIDDGDFYLRFHIHLTRP